MSESKARTARGEESGMSKFNIGDVVRLKSGGPEMTVDAIDEGAVSCRWFPLRGGGGYGGYADWGCESERASFAAASLEMVRAAEPGTVTIDYNAQPYTLLIVGVDLADCGEAAVPDDVPTPRETVRATIGELLPSRLVDRVVYGPRLRDLLDTDPSEVRLAKAWNADTVLTRVKS